MMVLQTGSMEGLNRWEQSMAQGSVIGLPLLMTVFAAVFWGYHTDRLGARRPTLVKVLAL